MSVLVGALTLAATHSHALFSATPQVAGNLFTTDTLDPPSGLAAEDAGLEIDLNWTATPDTYADGYEILRSETSGSGYSVIDTVAGVATTSYTDPLGPQCPAKPTFSDTESTVQSSSSTSVTVAVPTGTNANDVLIAHIATDGSSPGFTTPTGWTLITTNTPGQGTGHAIYYRVATGTEPST